MQILATFASIALILEQGLADPEAQTPARYSSPPPSYKKPCPADKCFSSIRINKSAAKTASAVCSKYIKFTPTVTKTSTVTITTTSTGTTQVDLTLSAAVTTTTATITPPTVTVSPTCSTVISTVQSEFATMTNFRVRGMDFRVRGMDPENFRKRAEPTVSVPTVLGANCGSGNSFKSKISSACSCLLGTTKTKLVTRTSTVSKSTTATITNTLSAETVAVTSTVEAPTPTSTDCQTTTITTTVGTDGVGRKCGAPISSYGTRETPTCANDDVSARQTNAPFRIEGGSEGNIFDGCIVSGPANITTPSGGTHLCDGTNNNANPAPGGTLTTAIDAAGRQEGFGYDGTYSNTFQDFYITGISRTYSAGNAFWGVLRNRVFTGRGGCQEQTSPSDEGLWAFDAFAPNRAFLSISPGVVVVRPGATVSVTVLAGDPNNGATSPAQGATLGGAEIAGADGTLAFTAPTQPGCYLYKAERTNAIRSQTLYVAVAEGLE